MLKYEAFSKITSFYHCADFAENIKIFLGKFSSYTTFSGFSPN